MSVSNPREQHRMVGWNDVNDCIPAWFDGPILVYFPETGAVEIVHCETFFRPITAGLDEKGNQQWTYWYLSSPNKISHWSLCPAPPTF